MLANAFFILLFMYVDNTFHFHSSYHPTPDLSTSRLNMSRKILPSLISLLLLLAGPSSCQAVVQRAWLNGTITFNPSPAGSATVLMSNATAVSTFATLTRRMFVAGIAARPDINPLFTAPPQVLSLRVIQAINPTNPTESISVSFTSNLRITSANLLTDLTYILDIKFGPYFSVDTVIPGYLDDLASAIPAVFGSVTRFLGDIQKGKAIPNPTPSRPPVASPTRRPVSPTRRPVTGPTRRPVASPTRRPQSCLPNSNVCGTNNALCCSRRCLNGVCRAATRGLALEEPEEEADYDEQSRPKKNIRRGNL